MYDLTITLMDHTCSVCGEMTNATSCAHGHNTNELIPGRYYDAANGLEPMPNRKTRRAEHKRKRTLARLEA